MPPWFMAILFGGLGLVAAWAIRRDLASGVARDSLYRFSADKNPLGFGALLAGKALVVILGAWEMAHALGLAGDPLRVLKSALGPFA
jgi:hypothetical protein